MMMAKKTKKGGKIPKEIGGIKLSKPLRKSAEALIAEVQKPATRHLLATGATMLMGAVMAGQAKRASTSEPAAPGAGGTVPSETDKIVNAVTSVARQAMEQIFAKKG
jgi:hypothetical protein